MVATRAGGEGVAPADEARGPSGGPSGRRVRWPRRLEHVVVACDAFKGSVSAARAAAAIARGLLRSLPGLRVEAVPVADGGEGTVEAVVQAAGGRVVPVSVTGPLGRPVEAYLGVLPGGDVVVEVASACGLPLVPAGRRDPRVTTSYGVGELVRAALDRGARRVIVGLGGSATVDGGAGLAQALGARLLDADGRELGPGGAELGRLARIETDGLDPRLKEAEVVVACDVSNPLHGPEGAALVYGPQKGADPAVARELDGHLRHLAEVIRRDLGVDVANVPGAGAAGGMGAALLAFCRGRLRPGVEVVLEAVGLEARLQEADLVITGEGRLDRQTAYGKAPAGVGRLARRLQVPALALCGSIEGGVDGALLEACGLVGACAAVSRPMSVEQAVDQGEQLLEEAAERLGYLLGRAATAAAGLLPEGGFSGGRTPPNG